MRINIDRPSECIIEIYQRKEKIMRIKLHSSGRILLLIVTVEFIVIKKTLIQTKP